MLCCPKKRKGPLRLIVLHVGRRRVELQVALDDLVNGSQEILLCRDLSPRPNCKHASFCGHAPEFCTCRIGTQSRYQLPSNVTLDRHTLGVNAKNVGTAFEIWKGEFDLSVDTARSHQGGIKSGWSIGRKHDFDVSS